MRGRGLGSGLLFDCVGDLGLGLVVVGLAEPDVVAGGGGHAAEAEAFMVGVGFAEEGVEGEEAVATGRRR